VKPVRVSGRIRAAAPGADCVGSALRGDSSASRQNDDLAATQVMIDSPLDPPGSGPGGDGRRDTSRRRFYPDPA
jgi:hypothetical protein